MVRLCLDISKIVLNRYKAKIILFLPRLLVTLHQLIQFPKTKMEFQKKKISSRSKHPYSYLVVLVLLFFTIGLRINNPPKNPISWDTFGYYLYLPSTFIYHDLGLKNKPIIDGIIETYHSTSTFYQGTYCENGNWVMKYSMGMAIMYSPGFFAGHLLAHFTDYPADGFSKPYQWALMANSILFFMIGMFFLRKVLNKFFSDKISSVVLVLLFFGTNYYTYSTFSAEMPHNYLFSIYTIILWQTILWHENQRKQHMWLLALFVGLATLARPTELISILIPLLWGVSNKETLIEKIKLLKTHLPQIIQFSLILLFIGSLQIIYWKMITGDFIYYSYNNPGEGFEFLWPYTLKTLFSFRKGWLIYTPLMVFALWGFIYMYKQKKGLFIPLFVFFIINLYIVSSWSCWWYAQSMGQRALIQSYAVLSIPFGFFLTEISRKSLFIKILSATSILFFVLLNQFQIWQMNHGILHLDRMTRPFYFKTFGKTEHNKSYDDLLLVDRSKLHEQIPENKLFNHRILKSFDFEIDSINEQDHYSSDFAYLGSYSFMMDSTIQFSPAFKMKYKEIGCEEYAWFRVSVWVFPVYPLEETPSSLIVSFQHKGKNYKYRGLDLNKPEIAKNLKLHQWNKITLEYMTPEVRSKSDNIVTYIWYRGKKTIYFDNLTIELFTPKKTNDQSIAR